MILIGIGATGSNFKLMFAGEILNIEDAYSHKLFFNGIDEETGFRTRYVHRAFTFWNLYILSSTFVKFLPHLYNLLV